MKMEEDDSLAGRLRINEELLKFHEAELTVSERKCGATTLTLGILLHERERLIVLRDLLHTPLLDAVVTAGGVR